jgi:ATP-dependent DNA helicase RecG
VLRRAGRRLGVRTVRELLFHLPRRYEDLREMSRLGDLIWVPEGTAISARVRVASLRVEPTFRRRVQRTVATLEDETGDAEATWFGRRFIERRLRPGDRVVVSGRLRRFGRRLTFDNPEFQRDDGSSLLHAGRIVPIYPLTEGLTVARLRAAIREALDRGGRDYPEYLPRSILAAEGLPTIGEALEEAHYPSSFEARDRALSRVAFDELLALQLGMVLRRRERAREPARRLAVSDAVDESIRASLERALTALIGRAVRLTADQRRAIAEVRADLDAASPMLRLLQGDVGAGKTAVAAWALAAAALAGAQGALLAPTDLLARQHAVSLRALLDPLGLPVTLLTGSLSAAGGRGAREAIAAGQAQVVVGTHALLQERVRFADLGLAVIDEQHRFGVDQRAQLEAKAGGRAPHVLLMTATPIPRTLGQVLYADLDVSDLRTPPAGRRPIVTGIRRPSGLDGTWRKVREEAAAGHRTFVVVPLIDESDTPETAGVAAAESEAAQLRELLAPLRVGLVHGRLNAAERDAEMTRFRDGERDVLVGTTVVEVGVDVPEATMMVILGADRFGLAQLHQLRGRVGRGTAPSYCVLVSESDDEVARARLQAAVELHDGFALAERDFELRREGNVLGLVQSGLPRLRVASLQRDDHRALAAAARGHAEAILAADGDLLRDHPRLAAELRDGWLAGVASGAPSGAA